jgi:hypothetical protein
MSKFDEAIETYQESLKDLGITIDADLLTAVAKGLGPSIYNADSSKVSSSDAEEIARVKNNFLIGKLGLADGPELDAAIDSVVEQLGASNRNKYRAIFYALLVIKLGQESFYA